MSPVANSISPQIVVSQGSMVVLDGTSSYSPNQGGYITAYRWTQMPAPGIPIITLAGAHTPTPSFTAPHILQDTLLAFNLAVTDNNGVTSTNPATVYVMVKSVNSQGALSIPNTLQQMQQNPLPLQAADTTTATTTTGAVSLATANASTVPAFLCPWLHSGLGPWNITHYLQKC